jgi:hypothetical protein
VSSRLAACCLTLVLATTARAADKEKEKVGNFVPFDLAVCFMKPTTVEAPATDTALSGLWILARPLALECMADTRFYVPGKSPAFKITLTVNDAGFTQTVDSDGLTAFGKKCLQDAVTRVSPKLAPLPAGSKPATFSEQWPELPPTTQVRFGVNEFSDVTGTVRLSLPAMCPCFAPFEKGPDPAAIGLKVQLTQAPEKFKTPEGGLPPPVVVTVADTAPAAVKSCLTPKLTALPYAKSTSDQIVVPYEITFLNSVAESTDTATLPDSVRFAQLDAMAVPRAATSQLELDRKVKSSDAYNALVKQYQDLAKKDPKKAKGMLKDLVAGCKQMVAQDEVYISALESESKLRQEQLTVVTALGAKNAAWAPLEAAAKKTAGESEALVNKAKELKTSDEKVCPKVHL